MSQVKRILRVGAIATCLAGCTFSAGSQSPGDAAVELIEEELTTEIGLDLNDIECGEPSENEVGATLTCTASVADGEGSNAGAIVTFVGVLEEEQRIFVSPSNIISQSEMEIVEQEAATVLSAEIGVPIAADDVECPEELTVLVDDQMTCEITDTANGDRYEMILTATEFVVREGFSSLFFEVGDLID